MNINIDIYLRSAFQELSAFSIPDIGTFRKLNRASWIGENGLHMHPPGTDIEFSQEVDAGILLSAYFSEKIGLDEEVAEQISTQIRQVILHELRHKGKFEIGEIGLIKKADKDKLTFENYASKSNSLSENYFGLSPIKLSEPTTEITTFRKNTDMKKTDRPESKQTLSTIGLKSFLLVALLFALGFLLVNQSPLIVHRSSITQGLKVEFNNNNKIEDKIAARGPVEKNIDSKPSEIEVVEEKEAQPEVNPRLSIEKNRKNSPIPPVNKEDDITVPAIEDLLADGDIPANANARLGQSRGQESIEEAADSNARSETSSIKAIEYHLIVGSFKSLNTANKAVSTWKNQGYKAIVLFSPAGSSLTHRVSVFKSTNRGEVEKFANRLKAKGKKSTWIYEDRYQN